MEDGTLVFAGVTAAIVGSALIVFFARRRIVPPEGSLQVRLFGVYSPALTWARQQTIPHWLTADAIWKRGLRSSSLAAAIDIAVIGAWALWVGRNFLDFNPFTWPIGREFGVQIYGFHFWDLLWRCGACSLWNGMLNGGSPFLADPFTGALHPISAVAGTVAGPVNAAKLTFLASIWMAGVAQWWMGKVIGLGRLSRLWTALAATSGGHILGRMELGAVSLVLSTAATSLALTGAVDLALTHSRGAALRLGLLLALAVVAGHGYVQLALLFWAPWIALIAWDRKTGRGLPWRDFALAGALAVLLAGVLLVPLARLWSSLDKFTDPQFATSQPFEYIPLNLVIHDWDYYLQGGLGSTDFPYLHTLYIGWPAVVFAAVGLAISRSADRRLLASLALGAVTMFWLASGGPFRWIAAILPAVASIRHVALMASLAVPAVLALAGYGLDRLIEFTWPVGTVQRVSDPATTPIVLRPAWVLAVPLVVALAAADGLGQHFLRTDDNSGAYQAIHVLKTDDLQWVEVPGGEHFFVEPALGEDMKLTEAVTPLWWAGRESPSPLLEATRDERPAAIRHVANLNEVPVYSYPDNIYASVESPAGTVPCTAHGLGGDINVSCQSDGGILVVRENAWDGWSATVNGEPVELKDRRWLALSLPAGEVTVRLSYRPTDVAVGALLTLTGVILLVILGLRPDPRRKNLRPGQEGNHATP